MLAGGSRKGDQDLDLVPVPVGQLTCYSGRQGNQGILETGFTTINSVHTQPANGPFVMGKFQQSWKCQQTLCVYIIRASH